MTIQSFSDPNPSGLPITFYPSQRPTTMIGQSSVPVNFSVSSTPVSALLPSICVKQNGVLFTDRDIYATGVISVPPSTSYRIGLHADSDDIESCNFSLRFDNPPATPMIVSEMEIEMVSS